MPQTLWEITTRDGIPVDDSPDLIGALRIWSGYMKAFPEETPFFLVGPKETS